MKFKKIDHVAMVTARPDDCIKFYKTLGFQVQDIKDRYELTAGDFKINLYVKGKENILPFAEKPTPGAYEICLELDNDLDILKDYLEKQGLPVEDCGIVPRMGARGAMRSFFVRDPDGNLVEIAGYDV